MSQSLCLPSAEMKVRWHPCLATSHPLYGSVVKCQEARRKMDFNLTFPPNPKYTLRSKSFCNSQVANRGFPLTKNTPGNIELYRTTGGYWDDVLCLKQCKQRLYKSTLGGCHWTLGCSSGCFGLATIFRSFKPTKDVGIQGQVGTQDPFFLRSINGVKVFLWGLWWRGLQAKSDWHWLVGERGDLAD